MKSLTKKQSRVAVVMVSVMVLLDERGLLNQLCRQKQDN